jgi:hypothetical protein
MQHVELARMTAGVGFVLIVVLLVWRRGRNLG